METEDDLDAVSRPVAKPNVLCDTCRAATSRIATEKPSDTNYLTILLSQSLIHLISSAQRGCHFCTLLQYRIQTIEIDADVYSGHDREFQMNDSIYLHWKMQKEWPSSRREEDILLYVSYREKMNRLRNWYSDLRIWVGQLPDNPTGQYALRMDNAIESASNSFRRYLWPVSRAHWDLARFWLQECLRKHEICQLDMNVLAPTRLIDVRDADFSSPVRLRIVEDIETPPQYCALSHCWGKRTNFQKLTTNNLDAWQRSIPVSTLAKTFRHAIIATKLLGVRYLWIDSLCIVQDSAEDWHRESARMGDIFEGAICCIAAANSKDSEDGIFHPRNPLMDIPCLIAERLGNKLFAFPDYHSPWYHFGLAECRKDSPLYRRGWVFQETVLALRTILFTSKGILWACCCGTASEIYPHGDDTNSVLLFGSSAQRLTKRSDSQCSNIEGPTRLLLNCCIESVRDGKYGIRFHRAWYDLLEGYNGRLFTYSGDKLIAISGIAERIIKRTGLTYVAGLWKETFLYDLLWIVRLSSGHRAKTYRAPSWSWASLDGPVYSFLGEFSRIASDGILAEVKNIDVVTHPIDHHKTGQVIGAELRLLGRTKKLIGIEAGDMEINGPILAWMMSFNLRLDESFRRRVHLTLVPLCFADIARTVYQAGTQHGKDEFCRAITGLVLQETPSGAYHRIGVFSYEEDINRDGPQGRHLSAVESWEQEELIIL